ncbi:unnamed protein product, partial [Rotaria magnacalcarata]
LKQHLFYSFDVEQLSICRLNDENISK